MGDDQRSRVFWLLSETESKNRQGYGFGYGKGVTVSRCNYLIKYRYHLCMYVFYLSSNLDLLTSPLYMYSDNIR